MCGRTLVINPHAVSTWFEIEDPPEAFLVPRFNIAPSQPLPIVRTPHRLELLRWGIARPGRPPQINTRVESLARASSQQRRCLVTVEGFYEWQREGAHSQPFLLRDLEGHPFALAGIWSSTATADGEVVESVSVLTCPPLPPVAAIHERMPLVIPKEGYGRWLDRDADVADLLHPAEMRLVATPVSTYVNSPKNDDPRCIEPAPLQPRQGALF